MEGSLKPFLTFDVPFNLADSICVRVDDGDKTGLVEGDGDLNYGLDNTVLSQVGNRFGNTTNLGLKD